jgi:acetate kinase
MSEAIVVINAGSSSLKFSVYEVSGAEPGLVAHGQVEGLGTQPRFRAKDAQGRLLADAAPEAGPRPFGHHEAFAQLAGWIREQYGAQLAPAAVGHRIVHGGAEFVRPTRLTEAVLARLEELVPLVPLHQPHNLAGVRAVRHLLPDLPQVGCFDTAFHQGRASVTERFGLPDELYRRGVRRWGFHGLSYEAIAGKLRQLAPEIAAGRVIVAHLGSGASLCAMRDGRSVDTTMGFSALDGLPMGTRCGSLDAGVLLFLLREGRSGEQLEDLLYRQSGLLGISGVSNDVRDLLASDRPLAREAIEFFVHRVAREVGSLTAALEGLDALVFTAGIGENSPMVREQVCARLGWLGIGIDARANEVGRGRISPPGQSPAVWVIPTDEEGVIARQTLSVLRASGASPAGRGG